MTLLPPVTSHSTSFQNIHSTNPQLPTKISKLDPSNVETNSNIPNNLYHNSQHTSWATESPDLSLRNINISNTKSLFSNDYNQYSNSNINSFISSMNNTNTINISNITNKYPSSMQPSNSHISSKLGSNTNNSGVVTISKRFARFRIPRELDTRGKVDVTSNNLRRKKEEVINKVPLTQFVYHNVPEDWQLIRTTPSNPRQMPTIQSWQPVEGLRKLRGHTGGSFSGVLPDYTCLWTHGAAKSLISRIYETGGRDYTGQIKTRHRGYGKNHKGVRYYRVIDFKRSILDEEGFVERIEFDPYRSAYIALVRYPESKRIQYIIAVDGLKPGDVILSTRTKQPKFFRPGFAMPLKYVPSKASICCIEGNPGKGAQYIRSAGTYAKVLNKNGTRKGYALLELQSKELKLFPLDCMVVLGRISNLSHSKIDWGSAGRRRRRGWRPEVSGICMNPRDHPHGGGEGHKRTRPFYGGGMRTFKGQHQFGYKTRRRYKWRVPVPYQRILKRRPRHFKPGQLF